MQPIILMITLALMALVSAAFWICISGSSKETKASPPKLEGYRSALVAGLAGISAVVCYFTLASWPHMASARGDAVTVTVQGEQWAWEMSTDTVPANKQIVFAVSSKDVNHGFGVYDESGTILFQTQAMPGYVNKVAYTFTKPGEYRVFCMEYCAGAHHDMTSTFRVTAN